MDAETKVAKQRLSVLQLAEVLGNVSEACRRRGMTRTQFYEYKRRFQTQGLEGLKDLPPIPKSHPMTTPPERVESVLALAHPAFGCNKLEALLLAKGKRLSNFALQRILLVRQMGSRYEHWLMLEKKHAVQAIELTGELLSQDTSFVGVFKGIGKVSMHRVVDTFSSHAFGFLHISTQPEAAVVVLHNGALLFYKRYKPSVATILTDNGREFFGAENHPCELYLAVNVIEHCRIGSNARKPMRFVERFHRTVLDEFYRVMLRERVSSTVDASRGDLDEWLWHYNRERPHLGYRNNGRTPYETVQLFISPLVEKAA